MKRKDVKLIAVTALPGIWVVFAFMPFGADDTLSMILLYGALVWLVGAVAWLMFQRSWKMALCLAFLNPVSVWFSAGMASYFGPRLETGEFPQVGNPSRVTRCYHVNHCFRPAASHRFFEHCANKGLVVVCRLLGPPHGTYDGPYPTLAQVRQTLAQSEPLSAELFFRSQEIQVPGLSLVFDANSRKRILAWAQVHEPAQNDSLTIKISRFEQRCLILWFPSFGWDSQSGEAPEEWNAVLVDQVNLRPFARYYLVSRRE